MKSLKGFLVGGASLALVLAAGSAQARRPAKPVVCELYAIVADADPLVGWERPVAVCYDKHDLRPLKTYTEVTVQGPNGPVTVVVGYR